MVGAVNDLTTNFKFYKVNFDWVAWHDYEWANWDAIDALLNVAIGYLNIVGVWKSNTAYLTGQTVVDPDDLISLWTATDDHTSGTTWDGAEQTAHWTPTVNPGAAVSSVFGRTGNIVADEADYQAFYPLIADLTAVADDVATNTGNIATNAGLIAALDAGKSDVGHTHLEANITDLDKYTQAEVDGFLAGKANTSHTHTEGDITDLDKYTQAEVDAALAAKANTSHTHSESDITDLDKYTQAEVDAAIAAALASAGWSEHGSSPATPSAVAVQEFTSLAATIKHFKIALFDIDLSGSNDVDIELGTASSYETTGYNASQGQALVAGSAAVQEDNSAVKIDRTSNGSIVSGVVEFTYCGSNKWSWSGTMWSDASSASDRRSIFLHGSKTLAGALTRVRVKSSGSDNFENNGVISFFSQ